MNKKRPHHDHVKVCIAIVDCPTQLAIVMCFITNIKRNTAELSAKFHLYQNLTKIKPVNPGRFGSTNRRIMRLVSFFKICLSTYICAKKRHKV